MEKRKPKQLKCRLCKKGLQLREQPEGVCDECLRVHAVMSMSVRKEVRRA